jgi:hypothetical protein
MKSITTICIIIVLLFVALLPTLFSTKSGINFLITATNKIIDGTIEVDDLQLHWLGKQKVTGFNYKNKDNNLTVHIDTFSTKTPLPTLLFTHILTGTTEVDNFSVNYRQQGDLSNSFTFPIKKLSAPLYIESGLVTIEKEGTSSTYVNNIHVEINPEENLIYIKADAIQTPHQGTLLINGTLGKDAKIVATLSHFPLTPFSLFETTKWVSEALGPELSGEASLERQEGVMKLSATMNSLNLQLNIQGQAEKNLFTFFNNSVAEVTITPTFFKSWFNLTPDSPLFLAESSHLILDIKKCDLPLSLKDFTLDKVAVDASFHTTPITLIYHDKNYLFTTFEGSIEKKESLLIKYQAAMQAPYMTTLEGSFIQNQEKEIFFTSNIEKMPSLFLESLLGIKDIVTTFGESVRVNLNATARNNLVEGDLDVTTDQAKVIGHIRGKDVSDLSLSLMGDIPIPEEKKELLGDRFIINLKSRIAMPNYTFSHAFFHGRAQNPYINADLSGKLGEEGKEFSWDLVNLTLNGTIDSPPLFISSGIKELARAQPFYLHVEGEKEELSFDIDLDILKAKGKVFNFINERELNFKEASWIVESEAKELPLSLIAVFNPKFSFLPEAIGPTLSFQTTVSHDPSKELHTSIDLDLNSRAFYAKASLQIDSTLVISSRRPTIIHYDLTKERYRVLLKQWPGIPLPPFLLTNDGSIEFTITQLTCPKSSFTGIQEFICKLGFVGNLSLSSLTFTNETNGKQFILDKSSATIEGENFSKALSFVLYTTFITEEKEALLTFNGTLLNLFTTEGKLDEQYAELQGNLTIDPVPTEYLFGMLPIQEGTRTLIDAILGDQFSVEASFNLKEHHGPIVLNIRSSNLKATCPLYFTNNNRLILTAPLDAEIALTHKINDTLIKDINPILISGIYSDHPLRLHIDPSGFSMPLLPMDFKAITIEKAYIDIGQIEVVYGGEIQKTMEFLKAKELSENGVMPAWFTPVYFTLSEGNIEYARFDLLLAGNVHLAFWGKIDLIKDKVRMTMAIAPSTLQRSFGIKGLTSKQMFHVKMRGSTSNVELDWSAATRRLGILIASSAGGQIGSLVGGLVEQIVTSLGEKPTPPPTTDPLPWSASSH